MAINAKSLLVKILSFLLFQLSWWGLFLAAKSSPSAEGYLFIISMFLITGLFLFLQLKFFSTNPRLDLSVAKKSFLFGFGVDGTMILFGFLTPGPALDSLDYANQVGMLCLTLILLWVIFSMTLNSSLKTIRAKPFAFIVLCAFFAPVTYLATERLLFLKYSEPHFFSVGLHALLWAVWGWIMSSKEVDSAHP